MNRKNKSSRIAAVLIAVVLIALSAIYYSGVFGMCTEPTVTSPSDASSADVIPEPPKAPDSATVQLAGDVLIHKTVYNQAKIGDNTYDFTPYVSEFADVFAADLSIVNLENPIDAYGENKNLSTFPYFNAPREVLDALVYMGVDLCTTANNHAFDQKLAGVQATIENIASAGLDSVGTYALPEDTDNLYITEIGGIKIGVCSFTEHLNGVYVPDDAEYIAPMVRPERSYQDEGRQIMLDHVARLREAGAEVVIACLHWGAEYADKPSAYQRETAQLLCDAGVDVIAGAHSHCVQPIEWTTSSDGEHRMLTVYSMGNFFANQTGLGKPKTQYGMVVSVRFERSESGEVGIDDAFYMPTLAYRTGGKGADFMRLVPAGQTEEYAEQGQKAYEYVTEVAGGAIDTVAGPQSYPDGFFEAAVN